MEITASILLDRARAFERSRPHRKPVPSTTPDQVSMGELLTPEQLAQRLHCSVGYIYEKRRPRVADPLPAIPMGRTLLFNWNEIVKWLERRAAEDLENIKRRRGQPKRSKNGAGSKRAIKG